MGKSFRDKCDGALIKGIRHYVSQGDKKVNAEMMEDALNRVQSFIDKNIKGIGKGGQRGRTYIDGDELGAMIFLVKSILSDYPLARPHELYKDEYACRFDGVHLGFMLNTSSYDNLGFDCDGKNYVSVFTFETDESIFVNEQVFDRYMNYDTPGRRQKSCQYVLFFKGCDDCSYGLRFKSAEAREQFIDDHRIFTEFIRTECLCYN